MCGCLFLSLGAFFPRIALVVMMLFTNLVTRPFNALIVPLLGIVLLPYTTLIYVLVYQIGAGVRGYGWLLVAVGFVIDLGAYTGSGRHARRRRLV